MKRGKSKMQSRKNLLKSSAKNDDKSRVRRLKRTYPVDAYDGSSEEEE